jgi:hypothetical protein
MLGGFGSGQGYLAGLLRFLTGRKTAIDHFVSYGAPRQFFVSWPSASDFASHGSNRVHLFSWSDF